MCDRLCWLTGWLWWGSWWSRTQCGSDQPGQTRWAGLWGWWPMSVQSWAGGWSCRAWNALSGGWAPVPQSPTEKQIELERECRNAFLTISCFGFFKAYLLLNYWYNINIIAGYEYYYKHWYSHAYLVADLSRDTGELWVWSKRCQVFHSLDQRSRGDSTPVPVLLREISI